MKEETANKLLEVQAKLKAPKNQFNSFGNYNYRSCEDILEGLKPLLQENGLFCTIADSIELIGDRYYVKATVRLNGEEVGSAYAREEETKKGMDSSQITGSCSSYARKYALNGVFLIDDSLDADGRDNSDSGKPKLQQPIDPPTPEDPNKGCGKWEDWKTDKGARLGDVVSNADIEASTKQKGMETLLSNAEKLYKSALTNEETQWRERDVEYIQEALSEFHRWQGDPTKVTEDTKDPF